MGNQLSGIVSHQIISVSAPAPSAFCAVGRQIYLLQNHTLLAGLCFANVLATWHTAGTLLQGLPGVFPSQSFRDEGC